ncbi:hypothetical protein QQS21_009151 [Conoideocrella luteorostrata]|uniref:Uncharacterized protein n=1 Tax=Conoideocrella luteorostrata TaxID=1105319 RepID=A0AAJ0FQJ0_9HYPO|nr:hypothetical protein QQS21_009151 [Conoideocrella luteorostrata]
MAPTSPTPRRTPSGRPRGRPLGSTNAARAARQQALAATITSEPPPKTRYVPGGPGGGGRHVVIDGSDVPATMSTPRPRSTIGRSTINGKSATVMPRRERSTRSRASASEELEEMRWGTAAAVAASVKQAEDYKPREERSWEEFHPNLDIERTFMIFSADDVDGVSRDTPITPAAQHPGTPLANGSMTPLRQINPASTGTTPNPQGKTETNPFDTQAGTPSRRSRRPTREMVAFYNSRPSDLAPAPRTPKILPISNQTPKERLDLKLPSYRKTNRIELFESKTFGQARYVDKAMSNVGYQESDEFIRPDTTLIKAIDTNAEEDLDLTPVNSNEDHPHQSRLGRVEYDMDEQDDMWLEHLNAQRKQGELESITREVFEITITKIEKEWHSLEKRIPKPNPKPPQTHRPRSSSAAAVNGETQSGEEPDSKCAICDDGDCENTNAIVFCDGCNLAVHQECYGVPFIPEGQWLCRKCQLCGRGIPTCIFCPNTDGAFKQTNSSKWAHLLCAMWIPEVSLGNHTFMEPVMDVEKVPKTRWKLSCYICRQRMGACIQCSNKNCYQAFHVTCARRARLYLKMKTSHGALAVLDGNMVLKAFCDKHCPLDYSKENNVHQAARSAKKFYKRNMKGRIWADNLTMANAIAAQQRSMLTETPANAQADKAKNLSATADKKKSEQPPKNMWKLPSGAPIIPQAVFDVVEASIQRFPFRKRKDFLSEACRYWTLKREARRGAGLLKRLQLQMETFSSMELTRRDFSTMGPNGKARLARRIEFAETVLKDLGQLKDLAERIVQREQIKADAVELEHEFVDECYFPVAKHLPAAIDKAISLDKGLFTSGFENLQSRVNERAYVSALAFAQELGDVVSSGILNAPAPVNGDSESRVEATDGSPAKTNFSDIRERRKLGKRILKAVQPLLEAALRIESEISNKPVESLLGELDNLIDASIDTSKIAITSATTKQEERDGEDTIMVDADSTEITVKSGFNDQGAHSNPNAEGDPMDTGEDGASQDGGNIKVNTSGLGIVNVKSEEPTASSRKSKRVKSNSLQTSETPPEREEYVNIAPPSAQTGPPTPPQSNGSFGKEPSDPLTDGGVLWYLKSMEPLGTSILGEHWVAGRDAVRMLSEELTDLDDEELKGLRAEVDESVKAAGLDLNALAENSATAKPKASARSRKRRTSGRRR